MWVNTTTEVLHREPLTRKHIGFLQESLPCSLSSGAWELASLCAAIAQMHGAITEPLWMRQHYCTGSIPVIKKNMIEMRCHMITPSGGKLRWVQYNFLNVPLEVFSLSRINLSSQHGCLEPADHFLCRHFLTSSDSQCFHLKLLNNGWARNSKVNKIFQ